VSPPRTCCCTYQGAATYLFRSKSLTLSHLGGGQVRAAASCAAAAHPSSSTALTQLCILLTEGECMDAAMQREW
jgi:hypothetical protein